MGDRATVEVLAAVAAGGAAGALARHAAAVAWPAGSGGFPWATLAVNATGCLLIGVLMVLLTERGPVHPLLRPALGTGVLGGYTTFSAYAVEVERLLDAGRSGVALAYAAATPALAVAAAAAGTVLARRVGRVGG